MKFVVPMKPAHGSRSKNDPKSSKQASLNIMASDIAQQYMELLRLRGQVYQLEQESRFARPVSNPSALSGFDQPGAA
jgi:hypothetical protein